MINIPDLSLSLARNPETRVSSTSEIEPTYNGDTYETAPLVMQSAYPRPLGSLLTSLSGKCPLQTLE